VTLPVKNRLKTKKEIEYVFLRGKIVKGNFLFAKIRHAESNRLRFGFLVPVKVYKKATERNKIKRLLSEHTRVNLSHITPGFDIIISMKEILPKDTRVIRQDLTSLFRKINAFKK
jgi:ribonuclease P protein component